MKVCTAVALYDGEPTVFLGLSMADVYDQVWLAVVADYFKERLGREPLKGETSAQRVGAYFDRLQADESYNESIFFSEEELDVGQP